MYTRIPAVSGDDAATWRAHRRLSARARRHVTQQQKKKLSADLVISLEEYNSPSSDMTTLSAAPWVSSIEPI